MATVNADEQTFKDAIEAQDGIVLVDFWAEWCGPCKMFGPIYERVSEKHPDIKFLKVDTEAQPGIAGALQIQAIPTLMLFRDGILLFRDAGALPEAALEDIIKQASELDMDEVRAKVAEQEAADA